MIVGPGYALIQCAGPIFILSLGLTPTSISCSGSNL